MKKQFYHFIMITCCLALLPMVNVKAQVNAQFLGRYSIGTYNSNGGVAEITAFDPGSKRMFVINGPDTSVKIVSLANPANPVLISTLSIKPYGIDVNSVACNKKGVFALAVVDSNGKTNPSSIVFVDANGTFISKVKAGANTDNLVFTSDGKKLLCANEGEPNVGYTIDPEGSVSIIDVTGGFSNLTQAQVQTATFTSFNTSTLDPKIRIYGKIQTTGGTFLRNSTVAEDLEPEYITISDDNSTAWVTCQENNCLAVVNINTATVTALLPLGFKNHNLPGNGLDPSDRNGAGNTALASIGNWPVFGMYNPDGISSYKVGNQTYLVTANEGDARADWGAANVEEVRVGDVSYVLDTAKFGGATNVATLKSNAGLGRLTVTNRYGDFDSDGKFDSIFVFGARSFSIWNSTTGQLVWDSKDEFEQKILSLLPANFNAGHTTNALDDRSDNKGPEPESVTIGKILDSTYAFIALERIGGFFIYNITNPASPYFVQYINARNFGVTPSQANLASVGDLGPEGIVFVPRNESPNGKDLIILSNEVSGTVSVFQLNSRSAFQMQVLHASDMESGIDATIDAPNFAAVIDTLEETYLNTVKLASGDCFIPSPFLSAGEDPSIVSPLRNTASSYYSGTTSGLRTAIGRVDVAMMNIMGFQASAFGNHEFDLGTSEINSIIGVDIRSNGTDKRWVGAQFPYLSANLNFTNDVNLSYLVTSERLLVDSFKTSPTITSNTQKKGIAPSAIIQLNGDRVGLVGATTQLLASISSPGSTTVLTGGSDNMPALAAVLQPVIDSLRSLGINKIILMSHLQQLANEKSLAPLLRGVDIIIAGGSHSLCADGTDRIRPGIPVSDKYPILTQNKDNEPLAILNTTSEWKYVGRFVCDFDSLGRLLPNLLDSTVNGAYAADTAMVTSLYGSYAAGFLTGSKGSNVRVLTSAIAGVINTKDGNKFGKTNVFLEGRRNLVRTEETNFGNVTADANLWYARLYDPSVRISIKNGGGIRSAIGNINAVGSTTTLEKTLANPSAGKLAGDISQLDIENALRFNNGLVIGSCNVVGLKKIVEHAISATTTGATPGQFPQIAGFAFSFDSTKTLGSRVSSLVVLDTLGNKKDTLVRNGVFYGDTNRVFKFVTLDFLFTGGDNYPFASVATNRVNLDTAIKTTGLATFTSTGKEQDAFAEYMASKFAATPYSIRDTNLKGDQRIQQLNARLEGLIIPNASTTSSQSPFLTPIAPGVNFTSILTAGDMIGSYKMAGTPDGTGVFDNGNGTFTLLVNHEFGNTAGVVRAHGAKGAFISKWVIDKNSLAVQSGADLISKVYLWSNGNYTLFNPADTTSKKAFNRFCSADLPLPSAFYNQQTGLGTKERIFMNGEESGAEGRAFAHIVTGIAAGSTYELSALGKFSWENAVANPTPQDKTIVMGTDDATPGQVYVYIGNKTASGNDIEKAGLTNGKLYGISVNGLSLETSSSIPNPNTTFTLVDLGDVRDSSGASINTRSNALGITNFLRPEDGAWNPQNLNEFYFNTTNAIGAPSRVWRLRFNDISNPTAGGTITAVLDGTEGQQMLDNMSFDNYGHLLLQEDVGNNPLNGKIWQYTLETDQMLLLAQHDSTRFVNGGINFLTQDEESSGIIDAQAILGAGNFLLVDQAHYAISGEVVEGGQILKMFNPTSANSNPEISLFGNNVSIANNDTIPSLIDSTDFGNAVVGISQSRTYQIRNAGPGVLNIQSISLVGTNANEFSLTSTILPFNLAANATKNITVIHKPTSSGNKVAQLQINSNDFDEQAYMVSIKSTVKPAKILVQGNGVEISDEDATPSLNDNTDFGVTKFLPSIAQTKSFQILNTGSDTLVVGSISISGTAANEMKLDSVGKLPLKLAPGMSKQFNLSIMPVNAGLKRATINIASNDLTTITHNFEVRWNLISPEIAFFMNTNELSNNDSFPALYKGTDLGKVTKGTQAFKNFTVNNTGSDTLIITGISFSGSDSSQFQAVAPILLPVQVMPGSTQIVTIKYKPSAIGKHVSKLVIRSNDLDENLFAVSFVGVGTAAQLAVIGRNKPVTNGDTITSLLNNTDYGSVANRDSVVKEYVITNSGNETLVIQSVLFTGSQSFRTVSDLSLPIYVVSGSSYSLPLVFNPQQIGTHKAIVELVSNADNAVSYRFSVSGQATPATGINEVKGLNIGATVYPNPASQQINVAFDLKSSENIQVMVVNALGMQVLPLIKADLSSGKSNVVIDCAELQSGIYFVKITSPRGTQSQRLIISH